MPPTKPLLSFSKIQTYLRCPYLYELVEFKRWREGPTGPQAVGQTMHKTLDAFISLEENQRTVERLYEEFDRHWVNEGFKSTEEILRTYNWGKKLLTDFFKIGLPPPGARSETEKRFSIDEGTFFLAGSLDRIDYPQDGPPRVIEYKTRGARWTDERVHNDEQMTLYALGAEKALGLETPVLSFLFLDPPVLKETARTSEQKEAALVQARQVAAQILERQFKPNHAYCGRCEFNKRCPQVDPNLTPKT